MRENWLKRYLPLLAVLSMFVAMVGWGVSWREAGKYPEISEIKKHQKTFGEMQEYLKGVAEDKGALYAFEILRKADLPPQTDIHLLGHVVGDELYKQYGKEAISFCTQEFRNACSHTVVVGLMLDYGVQALDAINASCQKAPGGVGAYTMCFHGLGHGVLAYVDYDLEKTVELCKRVGTKEYNRTEYYQCVGGAVMEIISAGGHNQVAWEKARPRFISKDDPLSPCNKAYIEEGAKSFCYTYLTPALLQAAGMNLSRPDPATYPKAFSFCRTLPSSDPNRDNCIAGFGKEFIGMARMTSDPRDLSTLTDAELTRMYEWCALSGNQEDTLLCLKSIEDSMYWGGENDPKISVRFCSFVDARNQIFGDECFKKLLDLIDKYVPDHTARQSVCEFLPEKYRQSCQVS